MNQKLTRRAFGRIAGTVGLALGTQTAAPGVLRQPRVASW